MSGDFGGYKRIMEEARALATELRDRPETACPIDGTPLDFNEKGIGNCPMGNYRQTRPNQTIGTVR